MVSHINIQYVYRYYTAAILYGLPELEKYCLEWYQYNLMLNKRNHRMLQEIDVKLMKEIVISSYTKVVCVFPMVILSKIRLGQ